MIHYEDNIHEDAYLMDCPMASDEFDGALTHQMMMDSINYWMP